MLPVNYEIKKEINLNDSDTLKLIKYKVKDKSVENGERIFKGISINEDLYFTFDQTNYWGRYTDQGQKNIHSIFNYLEIIWRKKFPNYRNVTQVKDFQYRDIETIIKYNLSDFSGKKYNNLTYQEQNNLVSEFMYNLRNDSSISQARANSPLNIVFSDFTDEASSILLSQDLKYTEKYIADIDSVKLAKLVLAVHYGKNNINSNSIVSEIPLTFPEDLKDYGSELFKLPLHYTKFVNYVMGLKVSELNKILGKIPEASNCTNALKISKKIISGEGGVIEKPFTRDDWLIEGSELYMKILKHKINHKESSKIFIDPIIIHEDIFKNDRTFNRKNMIRLMNYYYDSKLIEEHDSLTIKKIYKNFIGTNLKYWFSGSIAKADYILGEFVNKVGKDEAIKFINYLAAAQVSISETKWLKIIEEFSSYDYELMPAEWIKELA